MFIILGYIAALLIGLLLGMLGGGGSILTVPVLVYLYDIAPIKATAYSLFIVGFTSLIGAYLAFRKKQIALGTALKFGAPSIIAVYLTRKYLLNAIPDILIDSKYLFLSKDSLIMLLFAILMVAASVSMIKTKNIALDEVKSIKNKNLFIVLEGIVVGVLTGLVGAGGGFLIIPALVILLRLPMKVAIGTSLAIISAKSLIGFAGDISNQSIDWNFLGVFSVLSLFGIIIGTYLGTKIDGNKLKKGFGWFVLISGITILINELF